MSLGLILLIVLIIFLLGGFSGRFGGYGYGYGWCRHYRHHLDHRCRSYAAWADLTWVDQETCVDQNYGRSPFQSGRRPL